jgi:UDP-3-O-[3-hydroxymyristoyl] glucosamine N-acyltransferase
MAAASSFTFVDQDGRETPAHRRENPDGTVGGWIAATANIHPTAIVEPDAIVEPGADVGAHQRIKNGDIILGPI